VKDERTAEQKKWDERHLVPVTDCTTATNSTTTHTKHGVVKTTKTVKK
jgi:hypothetical protein